MTETDHVVWLYSVLLHYILSWDGLSFVNHLQDTGCLWCQLHFSKDAAAVLPVVISEWVSRTQGTENWVQMWKGAFGYFRVALLPYGRPRADAQPVQVWAGRRPWDGKHFMSLKCECGSRLPPLTPRIMHEIPCMEDVYRINRSHHVQECLLCVRNCLLCVSGLWFLGSQNNTISFLRNSSIKPSLRGFGAQAPACVHIIGT